MYYYHGMRVSPCLYVYIHRSDSCGRSRAKLPCKKLLQVQWHQYHLQMKVRKVGKFCEARGGATPSFGATTIAPHHRGQEDSLAFLMKT